MYGHANATAVIISFLSINKSAGWFRYFDIEFIHECDMGAGVRGVSDVRENHFIRIQLIVINYQLGSPFLPQQPPMSQPKK